MISIIHIVSALVALSSGAFVLWGRKGTTRHRVLGTIYVVAMLVLNVSALCLYRLFEVFGPFHAAAIVSLATVVPGALTARRRRPGWLIRHYFWMTFSYIGLLAAAVSEGLTRLPGAPFWPAVVLASGVTIALGGAIVHAQADRVLLRYGKGERDRAGWDLGQ